MRVAVIIAGQLSIWMLFVGFTSMVDGQETTLSPKPNNESTASWFEKGGSSTPSSKQKESKRASKLATGGSSTPSPKPNESTATWFEKGGSSTTASRSSKMSTDSTSSNTEATTEVVPVKEPSLKVVEESEESVDSKTNESDSSADDLANSDKVNLRPAQSNSSGDVPVVAIESNGQPGKRSDDEEIGKEDLLEIIKNMAALFDNSNVGKGYKSDSAEDSDSKSSEKKSTRGKKKSRKSKKYDSDQSKSREKRHAFSRRGSSRK